MKLFEKFIIATVALFIIVYVATDATFEMITFNNLFNNGLVLYIFWFTLTAFYAVNKWGFKKQATYTALLIGSAFLWFGSLATIIKIGLLNSAAQGHQTVAVVKINNLRKVFTKSSFDHTAVNITYNNHDIAFETSRTNFFALEGKDSVKVIIGKAPLDNYFITKVFWKEGEISAARNKYWKFWWSRNWFWPVALVVFILIVGIMVKFGKPPTIYNYDEIRNRKPVSFWQMFALIMGTLLGIAFLLYVGLIVYVYLIRGGCPNCKLW